MPDHPWYDEVPNDAPLTQGDIIDVCPVVTFKGVPDVSAATDVSGFLKALGESVGLQTIRSVVMTQACDLSHAKVRNVILCPVYHLDEYKSLWEQTVRESGHNPTVNAWRKHSGDIKDGRVWNLTMLRQRTSNLATGETLSLPAQVVDFHEIFSLPVAFLAAWVTAAAGSRLRLQPPYREHLSQSFARFFMRVGLPQEIEL